MSTAAPVTEIRHIRDPLWTCPTVVSPADTVEFVVDLPRATCSTLDVDVRSAFESVSLSVAAVTDVAGGRYHRIRCASAEDLEPGLYDLTIRWTGGADRMPASVWVTEPDPRSIRFVHFADPHVSAATTDTPGRGLRRVIEQINLLNPDFAVLNGDLVSRYGPDNEVLAAERVHRDMVLAQRILSRLEVPLFLTAGNHDLAYPWLRSSYRRLMARPLLGESHDYSFSYGGVRVLTYEAFRQYDDVAPASTPDAPTPDQLEWLAAELDNAQDATARVLFYHYDYDDELDEFFDRYRVDLALFGHTSPLTDEEVGTTPTVTILDRPVYERGHFRLIEMEDGVITRRPYFNPDVVPDGRPVDTAFERPNDGTQSQNTAVVTNASEHDFEDLRVLFSLTAGRYRVEGGRARRRGSSAENPHRVEVLVDVPAGDSRRVRVRPTE